MIIFKPHAHCAAILTTKQIFYCAQEKLKIWLGTFFGNFSDRFPDSVR
ncbi:MAG: hypothetical protein F6K47_29160 [Symploca sp. SIO2E6]|nr:hypothetical protein [Symploca sp. SIO2E6]